MTILQPHQARVVEEKAALDRNITKLADITNPPAFPNESGDDRDNNGMTLRDYFAAKVVQVSLAGDIEGNIKPEVHASWAYEMANAMLKARTE